MFADLRTQGAEIAKKDPNLTDLAADPDQLAEYLANVVGPRIARSIERRLGMTLPSDDLPGVIDEAASRMAVRLRKKKLDSKDVAAVFYQFCLHVAQEVVASGWHRQRQHERSVPTESLDAMPADAASRGRRRGRSPRRGRRERLIREAFHSLSERDRSVLMADATTDGKLPIQALAGHLHISPSGVYKARKRARERFAAALSARGIELPAIKHD